MYINYNSYIIREITGSHQETLPIEKEISLENLIGILSIKYGAKFKSSLLNNENKKLQVLVLVNGENITDLEHKIVEKDTINILAFVTGG